MDFDRVILRRGEIFDVWITIVWGFSKDNKKILEI